MGYEIKKALTCVFSRNTWCFISESLGFGAAESAADSLGQCNLQSCLCVYGCVCSFISTHVSRSGAVPFLADFDFARRVFVRLTPLVLETEGVKDTVTTLAPLSAFLQ